MKDGKNGIKAGFDLPDSDTFDSPISLKRTRKETENVKRQRIMI